MGWLVGRSAEAAALRALVADNANRMVTLVGAGGVGKTALVEDALADTDSCVFVGLRSLRRTEDVTAAISDVIGVPDLPGESRIAELSASIAGRVIVLDNLEHLPGVGDVVMSLLASSPTARFVCTSRVATDAAAEHVVVLEPLGPDDAKRLLETRAPRGTTIDAGDLEAICASTGGLPLALELAAARLSLLTGAELAGRLNRNPGALGDALSRSTEWSHALLSDDAAMLLRRMAVFVTERTAADVEFVAGGALPKLRGDILDALAELVESSLVRRRQDADVARFGMLPPIHAFALARLAAEGEQEEVEAARRAWALAAAGAARQDVTSERHAIGLATFDALSLELRDVARRSLADESPPHTAAKLVGLQRPHWFYRGRVNDADELSAALLEHGPALDAFDRARVGAVAGDCATARGAMREALRFAKDAAAAAEETGNLGLLGETYSGLGRAARNAGDFATAVAAGRRSVEIADEMNIPRNRALARSNLAAFLAWTDAVDEALALIDDVLDDRDAVLTTIDRSTTLGTRVEILLRGAFLEEAVAASSEWSGMCRQLSNDIGVIESLLSRSEANARLERYEDALADADEARAMSRACDYPRGDTAAGLRRASALAAMGERDRALRAFADAIGEAHQFDAGASLPGMLAVVGAVGAGLLPDEVAYALLSANEIGAAEAPAIARRAAQARADLERRLGARAEALRSRASEQSELAQVDLALRALRAHLAGAEGAASLTAREVDVLRLLSRGLTDKEIAAEAGVAVRTVTTHVSKILSKLGVPTRTAAAAKALELDLV